MELKATRPAQYSVSPFARSFQTMTMAMQRARPIMMRPTMYSGYPLRKMTARTNIRIGPMTQFCTSDRPRTLKFLNTSPSSSYFTLASGGYIMRIRPMAMGILVVPLWNWFQKSTTPGKHIAPADADEHGEEYPQGEETVEKRELFAYLFGCHASSTYIYHS